MGKAKRSGTKRAGRQAAPIAPRTILASVAGAAGEAPDTNDVFDVVCSDECVVAAGLALGDALRVARVHNQENPHHDAQPVRRLR